MHVSKGSRDQIPGTPVSFSSCFCYFCPVRFARTVGSVTVCVRIISGALLLLLVRLAGLHPGNQGSNPDDNIFLHQFWLTQIKPLFFFILRLSPIVPPTHCYPSGLQSVQRISRSCVRFPGAPNFRPVFSFFPLHTHCHLGQIFLGRCRLPQSGPRFFSSQRFFSIFSACIITGMPSF